MIAVAKHVLRFFCSMSAVLLEMKEGAEGGNESVKDKGSNAYAYNNEETMIPRPSGYDIYRLYCTMCTYSNQTIFIHTLLFK